MLKPNSIKVSYDMSMPAPLTLFSYKYAPPRVFIELGKQYLNIINANLRRNFILFFIKKWQSKIKLCVNNA